jgi:hypothetical protein
VSGERDLGRLLAGLDPQPDPVEWAFLTVAAVPVGMAPLMTFREDEALTCIVSMAAAQRAGLDGGPAFRRITLGVHSSLEAVGLTAAVAAVLAAAGISANLVAAFHHDHVFVPADRAGEALDRLRRLSSP